MKNLLILVTLLTVSSCNFIQEENVIDKKSPFWGQAAQYQATECINSSSVLKKIEEYSDFTRSPFSIGDIYKINQDKDLTREIYVRVNDITSTEIILQFNSIDNELDKVASFAKTEYLKLQDIFENILCNPVFETNFTASSSGKFVWDKYRTIVADDDDDDVDEAFVDIKETLNINTQYPLFFYYYNGTKVMKRIASNGGEEENSTSKITIAKANDTDACKDNDEPCVFDGRTTPECNIAVDSSAINDTTDEANFLSASDCEILKSNQK